MAAGLGFKDFQTGEVLTAADVDGYLMQGIWVFANTTARDAAVTSPQEGNFAFLKDTNTTTYYTGSAWTNLDTTGMVNPMTTTGDTIYSSSGSTPARLGIGTAGQVLQVNSGATAPEWATPAGGAGNLVEIATGSLSGASVTISSLSTYSELLLICYGQTNNTADGQFAVRVNSNSGSNNYRNTGFKCENNTQQMQNGEFTYCAGTWDTLDRTNSSNAFAFKFTNTKTAGFTDFDVVGSGIRSAYNISLINKGIYKISEAVSSLQILNTGGNFSAGTYVLWGA